MVVEIPLILSRHAFSARDVARSGHVWRLFQDAAVRGSAECGWSPERYRRVGSAFVVRSMSVVHHREARYGEEVLARTGVTAFRRGLFSTRRILLNGSDGPLATAEQEWVHVRWGDDGMRPCRAPAELVASFPPTDELPGASMPGYQAVEGTPTHLWSFECWHTWMDPLAHANHPLYVDWCDEALARCLYSAGVDPVEVVPVADRVEWRVGIEAPREVHVRTRALGRTSEGAVVCEHVLGTSRQDLCARALTVRRLRDVPTDRLWEAIG